MNTKEYMRLAQRTASSQAKEEKLLNAALGLAGEGGEFADHIKKNRFQGHDLDGEHLIKELGDIMWYIAEAATALDTTLDEIMARNIRKLEARYPEGHFEADRSRNRQPDMACPVGEFPHDIEYAQSMDWDPDLEEIADMELKDKIYRLRVDAGLTLAEVAKDVGVSAPTIQRYESGEIKHIKAHHLKALADALEVPVTFLLGGE